MPKKLSYEFVKRAFEYDRYILLEKDYTNAYVKMRYRCPNGHKHKISWNKWKNGRRCPYCCGHTPIDLAYVKNSFEKEGYTLLANEYVNNTQKLNFVCQNGHKHNITWHSWKQGRRCGCCNGNTLIDINFVRGEFEKEGYVLLTKVWPGANNTLRYTCSEGHVGYTRWSNWYTGARCLECSGKKKKDIEFIKSVLLMNNYQLLSNEYNGRHSELKCVCSEGHEFCISWRKWVQGCRCTTCAIINNSGENHYNWRGGTSFEPYCHIWTDKEFKRDIKERDALVCQNPDCWGTSDRIVIHHIDYNKKNCHPDNLITVCNSCNSRANVKRKWHTEFYNKLNKKRLEIGGN